MGETYNIDGNSERTNLEAVETLFALMDERRPAGALHTKRYHSAQGGMRQYQSPGLSRSRRQVASGRSLF